MEAKYIKLRTVKSRIRLAISLVFYKSSQGTVDENTLFYDAANTFKYQIIMMFVKIL